MSLTDELKEDILQKDTALNEMKDWLGKKLPRLKTLPDRKKWTTTSSEIRRKFLKYFFEGHPEGILKKDFKIQWKEVIQMPGYKIKKLIYEGYPGIWVPALMYEPDKIKGKIPGVLNPNGHHSGGKAMPYKQARCINLVKRGMLAMNFEFLGMGELTSILHDDLLYTELSGIRGIGVFYLVMKRALDILCAHPSADKKRIAMTGLSGGGWQTIVLSSLDERVRVSIPVAGHSPIWQRVYFPCDIGDGEQIPPDFCKIADYDVLSGLMAPRPTLFIFNKYDDCCFQPKRTRSSIFIPAKKVFNLLDAEDNVEFYANKKPGTHNYDSDNREQLYRFLNKHFNLDTHEKDIDCAEEILPESILDTGIPHDNETLYSIAEKEFLKIRKQKEKRSLYNTTQKRKKLSEIIKHIPCRISGENTVNSTTSEATRIKRKILKCGQWSIPVLEFSHKKCTEAVICISDWGKSSLAPEKYFRNLLDSQSRTVLAADIFNTGEAAIDLQNYHMLISSSGERSVGVQTGQILALAEWAADAYKVKKIHFFSYGFVMPIMTVLAAALEPKIFSSVTGTTLPKYMTEMIRWQKTRENFPLMNCPGLVKYFDFQELIEMAENVEFIIQSRGIIQ